MNDETTSPRKGRRRGWWRLMLVTLLLALPLSYAVAWYRERPLARAEAALRANDVQTAMGLVGPYLERYPDSVRALALKARILVLLRQPVEAIRILDRIGAASAEDLHALARAHAMREQWSRAVPMLEQVIRLDPRNEDALYELTACRVRLGYYNEAIESAQRYIEVSKTPARGYVFLATIYNDLRNKEKAIQAFEQALRLSPDGTNLQVSPDEFFTEFGRTCLTNGQVERALELLERGRSGAEIVENRLLTGRAYAVLGKMDKAVEQWRRALELDPLNDDARDNLANYEIESGNPAKALEWLAPLESLDSLRSSSAYLLQRAYALLKDNDKSRRWAERAEALRKRERLYQAIDDVLVEAPQSFWARVVRAYRFAQAGNWSQAEWLMSSVEHEAANEPFIQDLARALRQQGNLPPLDRLPIELK